MGYINNDGFADVVLSHLELGLIVLKNLKPVVHPTLRLAVNGANNLEIIEQGQPIDVNYSLDAGSFYGKKLDNWIMATGPKGHYWFTESGWVKSTAPIEFTNVNPLLPIENYTISMPELTKGIYYISAILDLNDDDVMNGDQVCKVTLLIK